MRAKERVEESKEKSKRKSKSSKGAKGSCKGTTLKNDQVLETRNQRLTQKLWNLLRRTPLTLLTRKILGVLMAVVTMNGMMTGVRLDGMKVGSHL